MSGVYCVGGAVRDELLGLPVKDRDYVVVGSSPEEMIKLGFKPVGSDFPVFLHPRTHEEYALARTERKTAPGYKGFVAHAEPGVTLEEDLARRDLTINAIAKDAAGVIIDPFNGIADLKAGVLRHVSPAFVEDPVRILRVARFAARFGFVVAPETQTLMREIVASGEASSLVAERVWQEISLGLMEPKPSRMFAILQACGALEVIMPELMKQFQSTDRLNKHLMQMLDLAARENDALPLRFGILAYHFGSQDIMPTSAALELVKKFCERLKAPRDCSDLALLAVRFHDTVDCALTLSSEQIVKLFDETDAFRKPQRFNDLLRICEYAIRATDDSSEGSCSQAHRLKSALVAALAVNAGEIAQGQTKGAQIRQAIFLARVSGVETALSGKTN